MWRLLRLVVRSRGGEPRWEAMGPGQSAANDGCGEQRKTTPGLTRLSGTGRKRRRSTRRFGNRGEGEV